MEFTVSISGNASVGVPGNDLYDQLQEALSDQLGTEFEDVELDSTDDVEVDVSFTANITVEIDTDDLRQLVEQQVQDKAPSGYDITIDSIDEV